MWWCIAGLFVLVFLEAVVIWTQQDELTSQSRRISDLEMGRPVKIEDGPARIAGNRQDR